MFSISIVYIIYNCYPFIFVRNYIIVYIIFVLSIICKISIKSIKQHYIYRINTENILNYYHYCNAITCSNHTIDVGGIEYHSNDIMMKLSYNRGILEDRHHY